MQTILCSRGTGFTRIILSVHFHAHHAPVRGHLS